MVWKIDFRVFVWEFCILFVKWKGTIHLGWMYNVIFIYKCCVYVHTESVIRCIQFCTYPLGCFHSTVMNFKHKTKTDLALVPSSQLDKTIKRAVYVTKTTKTKWITMLTVNLLLLWDIAQYTKMYIWHIT